MNKELEMMEKANQQKEIDMIRDIVCINRFEIGYVWKLLLADIKGDGVDEVVKAHDEWAEMVKETHSADKKTEQ